MKKLILINTIVFVMLILFSLLFFEFVYKNNDKTKQINLKRQTDIAHEIFQKEG